MEPITHFNPSRRQKQAGFTLMELTVAIAIVAIIYGFLPAVQRLREASNRQLAEAELKAVAAQVVKTYQTGKKLPSSLAEITGAADARHGHRFTAVEMSAGRLRLALEPIPGITGAHTGLLDVSVGPAGLTTKVEFIPTPGAAEGRRRMLAEAAGAAANGIGRMAGWAMQDFHFRALSALKGEADSTLRQWEVFESLRGADGRVSFVSIGSWAESNQSPFRGALQETWQDFHRSLRLGALGENVAALPGLTSLPAVQRTDKLLNFSVIAGLTSNWVGDPAAKAQLLDLLKLAETADANGDLAGRNAALDRYIGLVTAGEAKAFGWGPPAPLLGLDSLKAAAEAMKY